MLTEAWLKLCMRSGTEDLFLCRFIGGGETGEDVRQRIDLDKWMRV